jgi:diguanylate cyclase (GGDEF)-like protein
VSECVRVDELVARRGGDEFIVVLNDANSQYTDAVVRRIEDAIVKARRRICQDVRPTATVTSVSWEPGKSSEELLREIDIALHGKKIESRLSPEPTGIRNGSDRAYDSPSEETMARRAGVAH